MFQDFQKVFFVVPTIVWPNSNGTNKKNLKVSYSGEVELVLPDISMQKSDHMNIQLIAGWEVFTKTNLTIKNTLFWATLFSKEY